MTQFKRWYDHDPMLMEVLELLKYYQEDLKSQAELFLLKIESQVSKETLDYYYDMIKPMIKGNRWYDGDPVLSRTIELLRIVPPEIQHKAAETFLASLKKQGITPDMIKQTD